jgi:hypothetical protein
MPAASTTAADRTHLVPSQHTTNGFPPHLPRHVIETRSLMPTTSTTARTLTRFSFGKPAHAT